MQRPGRLHVSWKDESTLQIDADAGTQTRLLHFAAASAPSGDPTWQGYSVAQWQVRGGRPQPTRGQGGTLRVVTSKMRPGYIRKNGVPYSANAVLTEYMNIVTGQQGDVYLSVTASVEDPTYLNQPFVRTYTFKKVSGASGWEPTPCWNK
jgi:hypothetical protein